MMNKQLIAIAVAVSTIASVNAQQPLQANSDTHDRVLDIEVHAIGGVSASTQNYSRAIEGSNYVESAPGASFGAGTRVGFPLNHMFSLTTGLDLLWSHNTATLTMDPTPTANSTQYISNTYLYGQLPMVATFHFAMNQSTQWYVDGGCYFATGIWGKERTHIFTTTTNQLNQLVTKQYSYKRNYFREDDPLIASHHTFDFGLTLGTGLIVNRRWRIGLNFTYGLKNSAKNIGPLDVHYHNMWYTASIGYII